MIAIRIDGANEVIADFQQYPSRVTTALVRALNRAIASSRTTMVREIARDTGLKSGDVRTALKLRNATAARPEAELGASVKRIPLVKFGAKGPQPSRGKGRGVTWKMGTGGRSRDEHAFLATMPSGHLGVFKRAGADRLPIREMFGPSLGHVFAKYRPLGLAKAKEAFETNFAHELDYANSQGGDGSGD